MATAVLLLGVLLSAACAVLFLAVLLWADNEDDETDHADESRRVAASVRDHRITGWDTDTFI